MFTQPASPSYVRGSRAGVRALPMLLVLLGALAAQSSVHADEPRSAAPRVLLAGVEAAPGVPPLVAKRTAELLARDLATQPDLVYLAIVDDIADATAAAAAATSLDRVEEGKRALADAVAALETLDDIAAEEHARRAVAAFEASVAVLTDSGPPIDAYTALGVALAGQGKEPEARAAFGQALTLEPTTKLSPRYGKQLQKLWAAAKTELNGIRRGTIEVSAVPEEAQAAVFIDGANFGDAPVSAPNLPAGVHLVRVIAEGYAPHGERVLLGSGEKRSVTVQLEKKVAAADRPDAVRAALRGELRRRLGAGRLDADAKPIAAKLAERAGASHLAMAQIALGGSGYIVRLYLFRADGTLLAELDSSALDAELLLVESATLEASRRLRDALASFPVDRDIKATLTLPTVVEVAPGDGRAGPLVGDNKKRKRRTAPIIAAPSPIWTRWWFWAGVGSVTIGVAGAATLLDSSVTGYEGTVVLP